MLPGNQLRNSDISLMKCGELFNKHFCKNKIQLELMFKKIWGGGVRSGGGGGGGWGCRGRVGGSEWM